MHAEPLGVYITALGCLARFLETIPRLHELAFGFFIFPHFSIFFFKKRVLESLAQEKKTRI